MLRKIRNGRSLDESLLATLVCYGRICRFYSVRDRCSIVDIRALLAVDERFSSTSAIGYEKFFDYPVRTVSRSREGYKPAQWTRSSLSLAPRLLLFKTHKHYVFASPVQRLWDRGRCHVRSAVQILVASHGIRRVSASYSTTMVEDTVRNLRIAQRMLLTLL